jgi:hypothetical protein
MKVGASQILILAIRVLLVVAALGAVVAGFTVAKRTSVSSGASPGPSTYVCPMHLEVVATAPIDCPICRMRLEPAKPRSPANTEGAGLEQRNTEQATGFTLPKKTEFRRFDATSRVLVRPMSLEMRAAASAESDEVGTALYYRDESELLEPGEVGLFSPATRATPDDPRGIRVWVSDDRPLKWDERTTLVRFVAEKGALRPGETGSVKFPTRVRKGLAVRASAIVEAPDGPHVFVTSDDRRTLTRRRVEVGNVIYDVAAILSGLRENEYVVSKFGFLLDVERRAIAGVAP